MGGLLDSADLEVQADYGMFGIADPDGEEVDVPAGNWLSTGRSGFLVNVASDLAHPAVRLEYWQGTPADPVEEHEVQETFRLFLPTGELALNQISLGFEHDVLTVPAGHHRVRITGWGRERVQSTVQELRVRHPGLDSPEREAGYEALAGTEHYLVQFQLDESTAVPG
ncbi:hypothetical protein [Actinocorallia libanotica]|uniref:Uncharacterized protein n=1 Tax=Actinocorallia libanotica TaxID=46162 RepID=A0ABP4CM58_9ACTN